ncbi:Lipopolysaccharide kinase [gut metagenome]|uniref:Lipopolysaccharide kinase n=1 Tax=gut metagenome TaxID=749906 RepID=J9H1B4_9ZZZZ
MTKEQWKNSGIYNFFHPRKWYVHPDCGKLESFIRSIPARFRREEGVVIHRGRNELRRLEFEGESYVVKSFHRPNWLNRFVYGVYRASKAQRSYQYAVKFLQMGVGTPQPVAYLEQRSGVLFDKSYYISRQSPCPYVYSQLFEQHFDYADEVFREIGRVTAILHEHGYAHKDYGRGNILFGQMPDGTVRIEIVDLNRMYIGKIGIKRGCQNFERLPAKPEMHRLMAESYAAARGFDPEKCFELMQFYRSRQGGLIDGKY